MTRCNALDFNTTKILHYHKTKSGKRISGSKVQVQFDFIIDNVFHSAIIHHSLLTTKFSIEIDGKFYLKNHFTYNYDNGITYGHIGGLENSKVVLRVTPKENHSLDNPFIWQYSLYIDGRNMLPHYYATLEKKADLLIEKKEEKVVEDKRHYSPINIKMEGQREVVEDDDNLSIKGEDTQQAA